jgi:8-oxo-dGTP diphosphatase
MPDLSLRGPFLGVSAVVLRGDRVLLGRRRGAHGAGTYAFPGGKPDPGEAPEAAVARELLEETGLVALRVTPLVWTNDVFPEQGLHFVTLHHLVEVAPDAEPALCEPEKCDGWAFHPWDALPRPLFGPAEALVAAGFAPPRPI